MATDFSAGHQGLQGEYCFIFVVGWTVKSWCIVFLNTEDILLLFSQFLVNSRLGVPKLIILLKTVQFFVKNVANMWYSG